MAIGSLEAALRERGMLKPDEEQNAPGLMHRPMPVERVPSCEQAVNEPDRLRLWGRCGYVPESRIRISDE